MDYQSIDTSSPTASTNVTDAIIQSEHEAEEDRRALQAAIDRRLGFSLTDPQSPVPSAKRAAAAAAAASGTMSPVDVGYDDLVSPRPGAFDQVRVYVYAHMLICICMCFSLSNSH